MASMDEIKLLDEEVLIKNMIPISSTSKQVLSNAKQEIIDKINENIDKIHKFIQHSDDDDDDYVEEMDYEECTGTYKYTIITVKNDQYKYFNSDIIVYVSASELKVILDEIVLTLNKKYSKSFRVYHFGSDSDGVYRSSMYVYWNPNKKSD